MSRNQWIITFVKGSVFKLRDRNDRSKFGAPKVSFSIAIKQFLQHCKEQK